jgi:hypothetical protein
MKNQPRFGKQNIENARNAQRQSSDCFQSVIDALGPTQIPRPLSVLCDSRLHDLRIAYWTTVPISNDKAAAILSLYLENQHPVLGTFDADLFIRDLVGQQLRFCSPFLVDAVLYYGCVG